MAAWCLPAARRLSSGHTSDQDLLSWLARRPEARAAEEDLKYLPALGKLVICSSP